MQLNFKPYQLTYKLSLLRNIKHISSQQIWRLWFIVLFVTFFVQLLTLDTLLLFYKDQAQIIDYGRLSLDPYSNWSANWRISENKPLLIWSYLGPIIAEISFQLSGFSVLGSRIAALIGGLAAATIAFAWLLVRKVPVYAAFGLSLAFILDPLFLLSQRTGRMDSWVIALCLTSCWILHHTLSNNKNGIIKYRLIIAGMFAGAATLVWPSAILLYPLILLELLELGNNYKGLERGPRFMLRKILYFTFGGVLALILLLIPVWQSILILFNDLTTVVSYNVDSSKSHLERIFVIFNYQFWIKLFKAYVKTFTPVFPLVVLIGLFIYRDKGLITILLLTVALIFASLIYEYRALYLIPYFMALIGAVYTHLATIEQPMRLFSNRLFNYGFIILVTWSICISIFVRTALGFYEKPESEQTNIYNLADLSIGYGNYKVFLAFSYEFYFVGRALGWQLYMPFVKYTYDEQGNWICDNVYGPDDNFVYLLKDMDYAIFPEGSVQNKLKNQLKASGLHYKGILSKQDYNRDIDISETRFNSRSKYDIFLWYLKGENRSLSYVLYSRDI